MENKRLGTYAIPVEGQKLSGIDLHIGTQYQKYVGVLRAIELLTDDELETLEFEGVDEETEDIIMYYNNRIVFDQAKKKEDGHWAPGRVKPIITHFIDTWQKLGKQRNLYFRFTTNAQASREMSKISRLFNKVKRGFLTSSERKTLSAQLRPVFNDSFNNDVIIEIASRTDFVWSLGAPDNADRPLEKMRSECRNQLIQVCKMTTKEANDALEAIYRQVRDLISNRGPDRQYPRKNLSQVIPGYISVDARIAGWGLPEEVLKILANYEITYFRENVDAEDGGESFKAPAIAIINRIRYVLWKVDWRTIQPEFSRIDRIVENRVNLRHIIVTDGCVEKEDFSKTTWRFVVNPKNPESFKEIMEVSPDDDR